MTVQSFLDRYFSAIEAEMRTVVNSTSLELHDLYGYLHYHLGWADEEFRPVGGHAGKRLRPAFCLLTCEACGGDWEQALPAAAAVELLHSFSLIHDDIEDGDTTRRGRPAVWALWGVPQAINAGDALYALAHVALLRLADRGLAAETVIAALQLFNRACLRLTEGQFMDIRFESQENVSTNAYLLMVEGKTTALLAASCELGALVADAPLLQREHMRAFGHHLGLAFQIQDDLLGIWGDPQVTGKPVGSDLLRRKKTLPIVHGLQRSEPLRALLAQADLSSDDVDRAVELLEDVGSRAFATHEAQQHTDRALVALDAADLQTPAADALRELALRLLNRVR
ncbi:MAG TPA: polyprenyl synthetase family protein [Chloroflexi bacterium]|nr:polyprenyl synthetase family protein [Chloroflexota bacterium]